MANPSSSHHRDSRERERSSRHHHHRTISSTTLLLVLSLILAVLAVMLSLPSNRMPLSSTPNANTNGGAANPNPLSSDSAPPNEQAPGFWTYLSPRRSQALVAREHDVAIREADVAKREADLLAGGLTAPPVVACPPCQTVVAPAAPPETIIKEVVREVEAIGAPRSNAEIRMEDVMAREGKVSEREKQVGTREEVVGKRESDASRRENWIMEQLIALGNDPAPLAVEREEFVYDVPKSRKILPLIPKPPPEAPPSQPVSIEQPSETMTIDPAHTRRAARPAPEQYIATATYTPGAATTAVEYIQEITEEPVQRTVVVDRPRPTFRPRRSFWDW